MVEPVVSNAGPLMILAKLNLLHLLKQLYGRVLFTEEVYREVIAEGMRWGYADAYVLHQFLEQEGWRAVFVESLPAIVATAPLDRGEQESIALAASTNALLLIDEEDGRKVARHAGVTVRGTLDVLIEAYKRGLIQRSQLRSYFAEIEQRTDIWISPALCRRLLQETIGAVDETDRA